MNNLIISARLVDYSSDEDHDEYKIENISGNINSEDIPKKIINTCESKIFKSSECDILPLPSEIKSLYADSSEQISDNPGEHGGKIRSFPHERGVWATYIYIPYEARPEFLEMIEDLKSISERHGITLNSIEDFHVSLSRTVKLRHHWIQPFIECLRANLKPYVNFKLMFQSLEVYENEERTRTFIGLKVNFGFNNLYKITQKVDMCLAEFKLPLFYDNPSFHLSCISCVGSKSEEIELYMADLNAVFQSFAESYPASRTLLVKNICCKSGNKFFTFPLKS